MEHKLMVHVQPLSEGFIVTNNGTEKAVEQLSTIKENLTEFIDVKLEAIKKRDFVIQIIIDTDVPRLAAKPNDHA